MLMRNLLVAIFLLSFLPIVAQVEYPDNIKVVECSIPPDVYDWSVKSDWLSDSGMCPLVIPLVGDVNDDGVTEIVCFAPNDTYQFCGSTHVNIVSGQTHKLIDDFDIVSRVSTQDAGVYGLVKLNDGRVVLVIYTLDNYLRAYNLSGPDKTPIWESPISYDVTNVSFADFNNDGFPEVYLGSSIYDAQTGILLAKGNGNTGLSASHNNGATFGGVYKPMEMTFAANMDEDASLELVAGNEIYSVEITNRNGTSGNSITLEYSITPPPGVPVDGHSQIADFNLDGHLDVLVSKKIGLWDDVWIYVWDVYHGNVSKPVDIVTLWPGASLPLIADIDSDGVPEVVIQCYANDTNPKDVLAYKYNIESNSFSEMWRLDVNEDSFSNSMSAFDFNQDGNMELIITDQEKVRIVNGKGEVLSTFAFGECTVMQYPVIADVDDDGSVEILTIGTYGVSHTYNGYINVFASATGKWTSARKVWNQYMYNSLNINEDLTVPKNMFSNAWAVTDPDNPSVVRRPYNNFLVQSAYTDQYARPFASAADAAVDKLERSEVKNGEFNLSFSFCNNGEAVLFAPYSITVYAEKYRGDILDIVELNDNLPVKECSEASVSIPMSKLCPMKNLTHLVIAINDKGLGVAQHGLQQAECDTLNNFIEVPISINKDTTKVEVSICDAQLPYTYKPTGTVFPIGTPQYSETDVTLTSVVYGCDSIVRISLTVNDVKYAEDDDITLCEGESFLWNEYDIPSVKPADSKVYTSKLVSMSGCDSIVTVKLYVENCEPIEPDSCESGKIFPAVFFTPNGDGMNDYWTIGNIECYSHNVQIYDRYGKLLKTHIDDFTSWDGTYNGHAMPNSDYWYIIIYNGVKKLSGHFILKR